MLRRVLRREEKRVERGGDLSGREAQRLKKNPKELTRKEPRKATQATQHPERPGSRGLTQGLGAKLARRPRRAPVESLARQRRTPQRALRHLVEGDVKMRGSERSFRESARCAL